MTRATLVLVHDPRVRWSVPAEDVVRIVAAADWRAAPPVDLFARLGPLAVDELHAGRIVVVRGARDREAALVAGGPVRIEEVAAADVLALPGVFADAMPEIAAVFISPDASMSLVVRPAAVAGRADAAP
jgi:hypothetical protein